MHFVEFTYSGQRKLPTNIKLTAKHKTQNFQKKQPQSQQQQQQQQQQR
jgi:hypothetical protein